MSSTTTAPKEPPPAPGDTHTNNGQGDSPVETNGFSRNGNSSFTHKTVEAVRLATERFFVDILHKSPEEARKVTKKLTSSWEEDLELSSK